MTPDFVDSIPQGDGLCRECGKDVDPVSFQGKTFVPTVCRSCLEKANREAEEAERSAQSIRTAKPITGIRARFETCTFDSYVANGNARAVDLCRLYADAFPPADGGGLCLHGGFGVGKTHLAVSVARGVAESFLINCAELLYRIRLSFDDKPIDDAYDVMDRSLHTPLLILDDLGHEKTTPWVWEQLYILINKRYEALLPTIFTTNLEPTQWAKKWGGAIDSRIRGMSTILELRGVDYRTLRR